MEKLSDGGENNLFNGCGGIHHICDSYGQGDGNSSFMDIIGDNVGWGYGSGWSFGSDYVHD